MSDQQLTARQDNNIKSLFKLTVYTHNTNTFLHKIQQFFCCRFPFLLNKQDLFATSVQYSSLSLSGYSQQKATLFNMATIFCPCYYQCIYFSLSSKATSLRWPYFFLGKCHERTHNTGRKPHISMQFNVTLKD